MKRIALFLAAISLHAATYYVSSAGNDSNVGSPGSPWHTLSHAVAKVVSGDTIIIVANGNPVSCNATLPGLDANGNTLTGITVQSSQLQYFWPAGYRTNPSNDSAIYGKCQFGPGEAIIATGEVHGFNQDPTYQSWSLSGSTFTLTGSNSWASNGYTVRNGTQIDFEINNEQNGDTIPPNTVAVPSPLTILIHYYIVNCSTSPACGAQNSTFQVSATSGGSPITITACDASCVAYTEVGLTVEASTSANTITTSDALGSVYTNGTPVTFASGGLQLGGTLPAPLQQDVIYYVRDLSGNSFKLAATLGGAVIPLTTVGTGMISVSNATVPHGWKFSGIEFAPTNGAFLGSVLVLGSGKETSKYSMANHFEFDRIYCHDFSEDQGGPVRCLADGAQYLNVHDSYIAGMKGGEAQAIFGVSLGPTAITNNFLEAAGENILYGGNWPTYFPMTSQNKTITGNYIYKPVIWKASASAGSPSGTCLYDSPGIDPAHQGGEWYIDTTASQNWVCVAGTWTMTALAVPSLTIKNLVESKSSQNILYSANFLQGSWVSAQQGQAFTFGQAEGSGPGIANDHITITNNKIQNVYRFYVGGSRCTGGVGAGVLPCLNLPSNHNINNNLVVIGGNNYCGIPSKPATCGTGLTIGFWGGFAALDDNWNKNTFVSPDSIGGISLYYENDFPRGNTNLHAGVSVSNSLMSYDTQGCNQALGPHCYFGLSGANGLLLGTFPFFRTSTFRNTALIGGTGPYGSGSASTNTVGSITTPANTGAVKFVNAAGGDYRLDSTSPYSAANGSATLLSTDGTDLGADIDMVNLKTSGARAGTPPWDALAGLGVSAGSTGVVFHYKAPTFTACTATVYRALARTPANQVAAVADNSANSVSDALTRELYVSGLQASTHYWYKLDCGGGVIMVGDVVTRATGQGASQFAFDFGAPVAMKYSSSRSMSSAVTLPAATRQLIPVAANSVVYAQVGTPGPATILIAP